MENVNTEEGRRLIIEEGNRWAVDRRRSAKQKEGGTAACWSNLKFKHIYMNGREKPDFRQRE